ncbi:MAG: hypothetical protein QN178_04585 [Armatimonadota bacterium]|nr:hypothetical protein [Armatimonadota bacterium]
MTLSPEVRQRIAEEERFRTQIRERAREEIRLRQQNVELGLRIVLLAGLFVVSFLFSKLFLVRGESLTAVETPTPPPPSLVSETVLADIARTLPPRVPAEVCVAAVGRGQPQIRATIELRQDTWREVARRIAIDKARAVGATLRQHGLALPAYVEVVSPKRWYGIAVYDRDTLRITWDPCPGNCEREGTTYVNRCPQ